MPLITPDKTPMALADAKGADAVVLRHNRPQHARSIEGLLRDPHWGLAHRQLGLLLQEAFGDERQALEHFEAYLATRHDAQIEDRIRMIKGGGAARP